MVLQEGNQLCQIWFPYPRSLHWDTRATTRLVLQCNFRLVMLFDLQAPRPLADGLRDLECPSWPPDGMEVRLYASASLVTRIEVLSSPCTGTPATARSPSWLLDRFSSNQELSDEYTREPKPRVMWRNEGSVRRQPDMIAAFISTILKEVSISDERSKGAKERPEHT